MNDATTGTIHDDNPLIAELRQQIAFGISMPSESEPHRLAQHLRKLPSLPDRFNSTFVARGWVFVEFACGYQVAEQALSMKADGATADETDTFLAENFLNTQPIRWQAIKLLGGGMADPRYPIRAEVCARALDAHDACDYLVSVPLILMLVDGFGVSITGTKSLFSDLGSIEDLFQCTESMAGHPSALRPLLEKLSRGQKGYSEKQLNMPLRNGILHGTRLNYANKVVAAKALNLLAAVVEWARDNAPQSADAASRKAWNEKFLRANLNRLRPETPQAALYLLSSALTNRRPSDAIALVDYHPAHTDLAGKMSEWRELEQLKIDVEYRKDWEVFGDDQPGQTARCIVNFIIQRPNGITSVSDFTIYASRPIALVEIGLPPFWQIGVSILGAIRAELQTQA